MKFFTMLLMLGGLLTLQGSAVLFESGKSDWKIVLPAKASATEQYAAEELRDTIRKISGAELPILSADVVDGTHKIILGTPASSPAVAAEKAALKLTDGKVEELAVRSADGKLYLAGNQPRGVLYAVYSFLQDELGARWFWPGEDGEFLPSLSRYELNDFSRHSTPAFRFREMTPCGMHYHVPTEIWMARNLLNGGSRTKEIRNKAGFHKLDGQHWVALDDKKLFETHPEWYSLIGGKRSIDGYAGCWSNPEFKKYIVEKHIKLLKERDFDIVNTFPADIVPRCECAECTKNPDPSSRWFDFYNELIQEIRKQAPELQFAGIAYQEYRAVPASPVKNLEYVEYCQYNRCYVHKLNDPTCTINHKSMDELKRWQEKAPMGIYGYEFDVFSPTMYVPFWNMLADEMKIFRDMKLVRMKTELGVNYPKNAARAELPQQKFRLANYIYAQLLWNPDLDLDALLKDWCAKVYGPAADSMYAYHKDMAAAWDGMKIHLSYFGAKPLGTAGKMLDKKLIDKVRGHFAAAEKTLVGAPERFRREVELEQELFKQWDDLHMLARDNAVATPLPLLTGSDAFSKLGPLPLKSQNGKHPKTEFRAYWSKDALHIQAVCFEPDMNALRKGGSGTPDMPLWNDDNIEIFLDTNSGMPYYHFAANPAGGTYDAIGNDKNWNPPWTTRTECRDDRWIMEITLPFASLEKTPKQGEQWLIQVIRNSKPEACGYPAVSYHDMSQAATIIFDQNARADRRAVWIASPKVKKIDQYRSSLLKDGWQLLSAVGADGAAKLDLNNASLIVIDSYQNPLPDELFRNQLIPALNNGAVILYNAYFWVDQLDRQYGTPDMKVKFVENAHKIRKPMSFPVASFATTPYDLKKTQWHTPSGNFVPEVPGAWTVLATQKTAQDTEQPYILARPFGKGMVVLCGDAVEFHTIMANALEYNKTIKR